MKNLILLTFVVLFFACGKEDDVIDKDNPQDWDCSINEQYLFNIDWKDKIGNKVKTLYSDGTYYYFSNQETDKWEYDESCNTIGYYSLFEEYPSDYDVIIILNNDSLVVIPKGAENIEDNYEIYYK